MPKKIDEELKPKAGAVGQRPSGRVDLATAAAAVVAKQLVVGEESVQR